MSDTETPIAMPAAVAQAIDPPAMPVPPNGSDPVPSAVAVEPVGGQEMSAPESAAAPPRPLDVIHQELLAAKEQHARDLAAVQASKTALAALSGEFHATLSWFAEEEKQIAADIGNLRGGVGDWFLEEIKKVAE